MPGAPDQLRAFSLDLLRLNSRGESEAELVERCLAELGACLRGLVGVEGHRALVTRALRLAAAEYPFWESVRPADEWPRQLIGLSRSMRGVTPDHARAGVSELLAWLLWLLVTFIGPDLTLRLLREVWPTLPESDVRLELDASERAGIAGG